MGDILSHLETTVMWLIQLSATLMYLLFILPKQQYLRIYVYNLSYGYSLLFHLFAELL